MKHSVVGVYVAIALAGAAAGCSDNNSNPATPSGTSNSLTASVSAPRGVSPAADALVRNADQPITLTVQNAVSTQAASTTYTFEVATDSGFASKVQTKDNVAQGSGGQTAVRLDMLAANRDYFWRARATSGGTTGVFGPAFKFTVGPAVTIDPPVPVTPLNGAISSGWPVFTVQNSSRTGSVGAIVYRFEIANNASFSPVMVTGTVNEGSSRTSFLPPRNQAPSGPTTLYWRAIAVDQSNNISSAASAAVSFAYRNPTRQSDLAAEQGLTLWPGAQPTGNNGSAVLGPGWDLATIVSFDGVRHVKPTIDQLRVFDLIDRGYDPGSAIAWMNANGYATVAVYYPSVQVIGFPFEYMALVAGQWELVIRVGA
jgi:hypothetical protein